MAENHLLPFVSGWHLWPFPNSPTQVWDWSLAAPPSNNGLAVRLCIFDRAALKRNQGLICFHKFPPMPGQEQLRTECENWNVLRNPGWGYNPTEWTVIEFPPKPGKAAQLPVPDVALCTEGVTAKSEGWAEVETWTPGEPRADTSPPILSFYM